MAQREFRFSASPRTQGRRRLLVATLFILILIGIDILSGGMVRAGARALSARLWGASTYVRDAIFDSGYFASRHALAQENAALRDELALYREDAAGFQAVRQENDSLRAILHLAQTEKGITAPVISSTIASPYGTFLVGAGTADAVLPGNLVVTEGGFVVGTITNVDAHTSTVQELFAAGSSVDVVIGTAVAQAEGRGGGNARATLPRGVSISNGDPVIAPSLGGRAVGVVGNVGSTTSSANETIYINLPVNLSSLQYVYITH